MRNVGDGLHRVDVVDAQSKGRDLDGQGREHAARMGGEEELPSGTGRVAVLDLQPYAVV